VEPAFVLNVEFTGVEGGKLADPFEGNVIPSELEETVTAAAPVQLALVWT